MEYQKTIRLKDGRKCQLRNGTENDGQAMRDVFVLTHEETDYLLSYPDEITMTVEQEAYYLQEKANTEDELELLAEVDGKVVGIAGIEHVGMKEKTRHRAEFGISIIREYWGQGIGRAMTEACIEMAKAAGYAQLELDVVEDNTPAMGLYQHLGFVEYGRNPRGFHSRLTGYQPLVLMRLELNGKEKILPARDQEIQ